MGEHEASATPSDVLVALGLGSCIGLVLCDVSAGAVGLAHVMLPESARGMEGEAPKFADSAVPALVDLMAGLGAVPRRLEAVLAGGAAMFSLSSSPRLEIGSRNEAAVRAALAKAGIPVRAAATAGSSGRTVRAYPDGCRVTVKEAGGTEVQLRP